MIPGFGLVAPVAGAGVCFAKRTAPGLALLGWMGAGLLGTGWVGVGAGAETIPGVVEVFSDAAEYNGDRSVFSGNVTLTAGDMRLTADRLEVVVGADGNRYRADGSPVLIVCPTCFGAGAEARALAVEYDSATGLAAATGGAEVCAGLECADGKLTARQLEWRRGEGSFVARSNVVPLPDGFDGSGTKESGTEKLSDGSVSGSGDGSEVVRAVWNPPGGESVSVSAREIRYDFGSGTAFLSGDASASRGESSLRGETIVFNRKTGAMRAESDSNGPRVRATFGVKEKK